MERRTHRSPPAASPQTRRPRWRRWVQVGALAAAAAASWTTGNVLALGDTPLLGVGTSTKDPVPTPEGLKGIPVPTPSNLGQFVLNKAEAVRLGKALFWDMQVGSDGKTACASCHFHAGGDNRSRNQVSPGLLRMATPSTANPDTSFQLGGPNYQLKLDDFPLHKLADPDNRDSAVIRSINDTVTSQGVFNERFVGVTPGASSDARTVVPDPVFHVGASLTRRVEPRNSPTVVNAVFNFRNFWDGRAQYLFNGVNPFGARDNAARVYKNNWYILGYWVDPVQVRIDNASLASQASGPPLSPFEMSADGRTFMALGRRLLSAKPLATQKVSSADSVLGSTVQTTGVGLRDANYAALVKAAFKPEWWNGKQVIQVNADGSRKVISPPATLAANQFNQMEANFSLFFGLALQLYQSTLVADDTPFDRYMAGDAKAMSPAQATGMGLFFGKAQCANCHGGAEFTNASVRNVLKGPLKRMVMGNGGTAVYDEGFYNIGVTKTLEDILNGGKDPAGRPLSLTGLAQNVGSLAFRDLIGVSANLTVSPGERIAVNGAAKTPTVRNVELTAPYFHNGDAATLRQVIDFYDRGGNFANQNIADLDPDIKPLGLTEEEKAMLVDFLMALTDDRVRFQKAPFDHPQLLVPNGHVGDTSVVTADAAGRGVDVMVELPAVGASGFDAARLSTPANFLGTGLSDKPIVSLVARHSGKCLEVQGASTLAGAAVVQNACTGANAQRFQLVPAKDGSFRLYAAHSGKNLEVALASTADGARIQQNVALTVPSQYWQVVDVGGGYFKVYNRNSTKCLEVAAKSTANGAPAGQLACQDLSAANWNQLFRLQ